MIPYPDIDPELVRIGPLAIRWYGLMYLIGFAASYVLVRYQVRRKGLPLERTFIDSLYAWIVIGLIVGARLGYVLFYDLSHYCAQPLDILALWRGGMSFHGGLIGSVLAGTLFCVMRGADAWTVADLVMVTAPIGLGLGRIGNFINGELFGRKTDVPWAMVFPGGGPEPRHPSQLYEFLFEGVVLFAVLWALKDWLRHPGMLASWFLILYGLFRFGVEFFREPDPQLGFVLGPLTMGQILSLCMVIGGSVILYARIRRGGPADE